MINTHPKSIFSHQSLIFVFYAGLFNIISYIAKCCRRAYIFQSYWHTCYLKSCATTVEWAGGPTLAHKVRPFAVYWPTICQCCWKSARVRYHPPRFKSTRRTSVFIEWLKGLSLIYIRLLTLYKECSYGIPEVSVPSIVQLKPRGSRNKEVYILVFWTPSHKA